MMKVLFISHESALNGAPKSMLYLIEDLKRRFNIKPIVLTNQHGPLIDELESRGIDCIVTKYHWWMIGKKRKYDLRYLIKFIRFKITRNFINKKLVKILNDYDFDFVHSNTSVCEVGSYIAEQYKVPHIWHIREHGMKDHGIDYIDNIKYVKEQYNKATKVICISESVRDTYKNFIDNDKLITIYNGIHIDENFNKGFNKNQKLRFCTVGVISEGKNQMETLRAIKMLVDNGYSNFEFNIIGNSHKDYEQKLKLYIKEHNIEDKVRFYGYRNDIDDILSNMDVGIMTSRNEAFGRVTVEYMSKFMPVIGSNIGGTSEIIIDNENGFLYEVGNANDLSKKMMHYIDNRDDIESMGKNAYYHVLENYNINNNTDKIYSMYVNNMN